MGSIRKTHRVRFVGSFPGMPPVLGHPEVAFAGRSNVGKSSALNTLLVQKKAARVSNTPGRTQALNLFEVDERWGMVDLPGYGFAKVPPEVQATWKRTVETYLKDRETLCLVVMLVDARHEAQRMDLELSQWLAQNDIPRLVLATKVDKLTRNQRAHAVAALKKGLGVPDLVPFSSVTGEGAVEAWERIEAARPH